MVRRSESGSVTIPGWGRTQIAWREAGTGLPVILIHCYPVDGRLFDAQLDAAERNVIPARVVVPDLPGFGCSPLPEQPPTTYSTAELAIVVEALLDRLGGGPVVLGGVAIGGSVAIELAVRQLHRTAGLILISNRHAPDEPSRTTARDAAVRRILDEGSDHVARERPAQVLSPSTGAAVHRRVAEMIRAADARAVAALLRAISTRPDPRPLLARLEVRSLVIGGRDDPSSPPDAVTALAAEMPGSTLVIVDGAGHMAPIEQPDRVTDVIRDFLGRLAPTEPG
jgi:pimeloyl-ACP methyl ester carboxylesterase